MSDKAGLEIAKAIGKAADAIVKELKGIRTDIRNSKPVARPDPNTWVIPNWNDKQENK